IYVPHNSKDHGAHNDVTVGPCTKVMVQGDTYIDVSFKAGNPPKPVIQRIRVDHKLSIDLGGGGEARAGRVIGPLHTNKMGNVFYVPYDGSIRGWYGYDLQPKIVFPAGKPLIVCIVGE